MVKKDVKFGKMQKSGWVMAALTFLIVSILTNSGTSIGEQSDIFNNQTDVEIHKVETGNTIKINFIGRFEDGTLFDTTYEDVGRGAGLGKEEYGPIEFIVGTNQVLRGLDEAVVGMVEGEEKNVTIPPDKAFGVRDKAMVVTFPVDVIGEEIDLKVGQRFSTGEMIGLVTNLTEGVVTLDFNNPLAGKTFMFTIELLSVNKTKHDYSAIEAVTLKYFWSARCGYCKIQDPILYEFLQEHPKIDFVMIDIEKKESQSEAIKYRVTGTPTFVLKKGDTELIAGGLLSKDKLIEYICPTLKDEMCLTGKTEERRDVKKWW
jgi:peptidylprolyl isomerase